MFSKIQIWIGLIVSPVLLANPASLPQSQFMVYESPIEGTGNTTSPLAMGYFSSVGTTLRLSMITCWGPMTSVGTSSHGPYCLGGEWSLLGNCNYVLQCGGANPVFSVTQTPQFTSPFVNPDGTCTDGILNLYFELPEFDSCQFSVTTFCSGLNPDFQGPTNVSFLTLSGKLSHQNGELITSDVEGDRNTYYPAGASNGSCATKN